MTEKFSIGGEEYTRSPQFGLLPIAVNICNTCGALIGDNVALHDAFHRELKKAK